MLRRFLQAQKLTQCPMGIIAKAAPILSEENLIDIIPVAWELILETDQELAASAGTMRTLDNLFNKKRCCRWHLLIHDTCLL